MLWVTTSAVAAIRCATSRPASGLEIDRDRTLAARGGVERLGRGSERVTVERFELDDVGAQVREQPARVRPGEVQPEVEHLQTLQRREHGVLPPQPMISDPAERVDRGRVIPQRVQDLVRIRAGQRCAAADRARGTGEARGHADLLELAQLGVVDVNGGVVVRDLRLVEDLGRAMDRDRGDVGGEQPFLPVRARLAREELRYLPRTTSCSSGFNGTVFSRLPGAGGTRSANPIAVISRACEPFAPVCTPRYSPSPQMKLPTRSRRDGAKRARSRRVGQVLEALPEHGHEREHAVEHRRLDALAPAGRLPRHERGADADHREQSGTHARERHTGVDGRGAGQHPVGHEARRAAATSDSYPARSTSSPSAPDPEIEQ